MAPHTACSAASPTRRTPCRRPGCAGRPSRTRGAGRSATRAHTSSPRRRGRRSTGSGSSRTGARTTWPVASRTGRHGPGPAESVEMADSVSMAMLVVLESLSLLERAAFVLHDVFGLSFGEVATTLDRSEAAVRQLANRARGHVHSRRPEVVDRKRHDAVLDQFVTHLMTGDLEKFMACSPGHRPRHRRRRGQAGGAAADPRSGQGRPLAARRDPAAGLHRRTAGRAGQPQR